jgi:hypothetical protein
MSGKFCINLTCSTDNTDRATVAYSRERRSRIG